MIRSIHTSLNKDGRLVILDWAQASIKMYEQYLKDDRDDFKELDVADIISYHRNFSRYSLQDWDFILSNLGFEVEHSFSVSEVHNCIIAKKDETRDIE